MKRDVLLISMTLVLFNSVPLAAFCQVPPILPTDVTGPMAPGGTGEMLRDFGGPNYFGSQTVSPSWWARHFGHRETYGRIITNPAVLPYDQTYGQPVLIYPDTQYIDPRRIPGY
jgi:hypothetical protein